MREIKFRGKWKRNGVWIYGSYVNHEYYTETDRDGNARHRCEDVIENILGRYQIDGHTLGQYTGLKDKNVVEIYEGDIVDNGYTIIYSSNSKQEFRYVGIVKYDVKNGCLVINNIDGQTKRLTHKTIEKSLTVKVIGNVHDNPELLKG